MPTPHVRAHGCAPCAARRRLLMEQAAAAAQAAMRGKVRTTVTHLSGAAISIVSGVAAMAGIIPKELPEGDTGGTTMSAHPHQQQPTLPEGQEPAQPGPAPAPEPTTDPAVEPVSEPVAPEDAPPLPPADPQDPVTE